MPPQKAARKQLFSIDISMGYARGLKVNFRLTGRAELTALPGPQLTVPAVRPIRRISTWCLASSITPGRRNGLSGNARRLAACLLRPHRSLAGHLLSRHLDRGRRRALVA